MGEGHKMQVHLHAELSRIRAAVKVNQEAKKKGGDKNG